MSMFCSPNDVSTSDPDSSSDEQDVLYSCSEDTQEPPLDDGAAADVTEAPLQREETASESLPDHEYSRETPDWLPNTAEQHATLLTSSLLEFVYNVKAAEHLNHAQGTSRFHRETPEARALGARMFQGASKILAGNGIIADCVHEQEWREMRQQYIFGVDNLGLQAFNESVTMQAQPPRGRQEGHDGSIVIRHASRPRQQLHEVLRSTYLPGRFADISHHREMKAAMLRKLAAPSPHADMQLALSPKAASGNRYKSEFGELKRLGKGGFGTVYHVKNFVDNQDYAIKKVPLDSKRLKKWQAGGAKDIEALLKEIRTLARLEHSNIVRYYAAWIEGADIPVGAQAHQLYLKDKPASSNGTSAPSKPQHKQLPFQGWQDEDSTDVVFQEDSGQHSEDLLNTIEDDSVGFVFGEDSDVSTRTHDIAPRSKIVPRQRFEIGQMGHDQSSAATSLTEGTDIFTDGDGEMRSSSLRKQKASVEPMMVLHIQMSLHPLSLATYLSSSNEAFSPQQARHCFHLGPSLQIISAILSGVEYLHAQRIIHRDLKPGNIFLSEHLEYDQRPGCVDVTCPDCTQSTMKRFLNPRIGDFGLVADISAINQDDTTSKQASRHSSTKRAVGTEFYRPPPPPPAKQSSTPGPKPEALIDEKLDVFALGILLFELLWKLNTKMERHMLLTALSKEGVLPPDLARKIDPDGRACVVESCTEDGGGGGGNGSMTVGASVEQCIKNMVCKTPAKRWGCRRVRERLDAVIKSLRD
jgi:eukaryotic translation initiation factor 2-alpha kinase 3